MCNTLAFGMPSMGEWVVVAFIGLLFFGKRLPEVGRSLGKGIVEFKKGLKGIEEEIDDQVEQSARDQEQRRLSGSGTQPAAKFDPYTGKPIAQPAHRFDPYTGQPIVTEEAAVVIEPSTSTHSNGTTETASSGASH